MRMYPSLHTQVNSKVFSEENRKAGAAQERQREASKATAIKIASQAVSSMQNEILTTVAAFWDHPVYDQRWDTVPKVEAIIAKTSNRM